ncbi:hypothetical protein KR222_001332, partial [Zaprionus bogoriensis]
VAGEAAPNAFHWQLEDYAYFHKCGEITTSPDVQCFGFNCAFCPAICLQFSVFVDHIRQQHMQDMRRRYDVADGKSEQTTQTDFNLMLMDMHMDSGSDIYQLDTAAAATTTAAATALATTNAKPQIDYVQVHVENPLALASALTPLPRLATLPALSTSDISSDEQSPRLHSIDPCGMIHELVDAVGLPSSLPQHAYPPLEADSRGVISVAPSTLPLPPPHRYETRRVAMQRKLRDAETAKTAEEQQQQQQQQQQQLLQQQQLRFQQEQQQLQLQQQQQQQQLQLQLQLQLQQQQQLEENLLELTPPATPPTPVPPTSPTSSLAGSVASSVDLKLRNREFVCALLLAYERNEKLWNPKHPDYKYNAKRSLYGELAAPLEAVFQIPLTGLEIFAVLKELRGRYRRELSKLNALGGKYKSRLWYFDKMHFLRGVIEHKRAEREAKQSESTESEKSSETDNESSTKSAQYREVLSFIIDAFRRQESLWNPQHFEYSNCCKKELYREISAELLEELNYELSGEECFKEMQKLRTRYRKELRMVIKHKGLYLPKLWCYDELEFLHKILQEQIFNKISKKKGVVETNQKTKFINASCIRFDTQDDQLQFVEIYRNYPALWDVDHPDFRSNAYRNQALGQMLDELNTTFQCASTAAQLEKTLFELRKDFSAQKRKILTNASGSSSIPLLHAKLGQFLEPNLGPFRCDVCDELVKTCDQYKVHRAAHDGTQPFICTLCGKGFQMPCNLTVHIRRHRRDFPYACEQCDKRFATSTEVAIHMRTHTGERPYICDLCGKSFKTWSFFDIHRRTHLNQSTFHCPICDKGFYEKNRFTDHMNAHLNIRKHLCTVCGKTFTTYGNLKKHTELHLAVKKYKCAACGKRFAQFASLRWHRKRVHSAEQQQQPQ